jgi:hypothetical protein
VREFDDYVDGKNSTMFPCAKFTFLVQNSICTTVSLTFSSAYRAIIMEVQMATFINVLVVPLRHDINPKTFYCQSKVKS